MYIIGYLRTKCVCWGRGICNINIKLYKIDNLYKRNCRPFELHTQDYRGPPSTQQTEKLDCVEHLYNKHKA